MLYLGLGQSLLAQVPRLRPLGEKPGSLDPDRAWVFAASGDPRVVADPTRDLASDVLGEVHPHLRSGRSGPLTAASAEMLGALRLEDRLLTVNLARRSARVDVFLPGGVAFRNVESCLKVAAGIAAKRGMLFRRLVVSWVQGQADARTPHRMYLERLEDLVDALERACLAVTSGQGRLIFCLSQTTATYALGRRGVPLAQLELAGSRPGRVIVAGPDYMLERSDGVHLKPRSAVRLGTLHGRAIRCGLSGGHFEPLRMIDAEVADCVVLVRFAGGRGELEADTGGVGQVEVGVRPLDQMGFVWLAPAGSKIRIVGARISAPREVTLTLSEPPQTLHNTFLALGFPEGVGLPEGFVGGNPANARGGATSLRTAGDGLDAFGKPIQDWALQGRIVPRWSEMA